MKWVLKDPARADMIRMKMGEFYHYGVFVSETEIIQFGLAPIARPRVKACDVEVCVSDMEGFLCGSFFEVGVPEKKELKKLRSPDEIVNTARSRLGEKNYNVMYNNCEHFAYECVFGEKYCSQTEKIRELIRSFPLVDVYFAKIPQNKDVCKLPCAKANGDINTSSNDNERIGKYFAWCLFDHALERTFGKNLKTVHISDASNDIGEKWKCDECEFDISYTDGAVAVVVSRKPTRIVVSKAPNTLDDSNWQTEVTVNDETYFISVRAENIEKVRFYNGYEF